MLVFGPRAAVEALRCAWTLQTFWRQNWRDFLMVGVQVVRKRVKVTVSFLGLSDKKDGVAAY